MAVKTLIGKHNKDIGKSGENLACRYLEIQQYQVQCRNYRCALGEIDIIAQKGTEITFFEVKTRTSMKYGTPAEIINMTKLKRMEHIAWIYLQNTNQSHSDWSIKIIEVMQDLCNIVEPIV